MKAYHTFAQQQRQRQLLKGVSPGEREKLLSQQWKALSKAEKAHYNGCEDTSQAPRGSAYSAFCRARRPLLPPTLSNIQHERRPLVNYGQVSPRGRGKRISLPEVVPPCPLRTLLRCPLRLPQL